MNKVKTKNIFEFSHHIQFLDTEKVNQFPEMTHFVINFKFSLLPGISHGKRVKKQSLYFEGLIRVLSTAHLRKSE